MESPITIINTVQAPAPVRVTPLHVAALMTIFCIAWRQSMLKPRRHITEAEMASPAQPGPHGRDHRAQQNYAEVFARLTRSANVDWMLTDNFADAFALLAKYKDAQEGYGTIEGLDSKRLLEDVSDAIWHRAYATCNSVTRLAQRSGSPTLVRDSQEMKRADMDVKTLKAILDSRAVFVPHRLLVRYVGAAEIIITYLKEDKAAEALHRKIRAILGPKPRQVVAQAPQQPKVAGTAQESIQGPVVDVTPVSPTTEVEGA
jgi:hypothetical protein